MDAEKNKKLQQYAAILQEQAKDAESAGKSEDAIKLYLKLVDVFLVLASEAPDHNAWIQYIRQAEAYQSRIRSLVPQQQQGAPTAKPPQIENLAPRKATGSDNNLQAASPSAQQQTRTATTSAASQEVSQKAPAGAGTPSSSAGTFSKILKPFQKSTITTTSELGGTATEDLARQSPPPPPFRPPIPQQSQATPVSASKSQLTTQPPEDRSPVPHELYERAISENKILQERLQSVMRERDERVAFLESRNRELEERVAMMVTRQDYDLLRQELEKMVPKHEYDRIRAELANSVPIAHYDLLLDRISNMVPREIYIAAERRALELEDDLKHSIPSEVIDDIANEVSLLNVAAEVPPIIAAGAEKATADDEKDEETPSKNEDEQLQDLAKAAELGERERKVVRLR